MLLDARSVEEFAGDDLRGNPRGGAIPGARNIPFNTLLENGLLREPAALRSMFAAVGLHDCDAPVAAYCQLGIRASVAAIALREAGFKNVSVYEGGAKEWLSDLHLPVDL